jgi:hypothetical protein
MSIDVRGTAAATEARRSAERAVDPAMMLRDLHRVRRRRRVAAIVGSAAVVAAVVGGSALITNTPDHHRLVRPATSRTPSPATSTTPSPAGHCAQPRVQCLGNASYRVALRVPVTFSLPANFDSRFTVSEARALDVYRTDVDQTGVTVMENPTPVKDDATWSRDPSAGTDAESIATWLANRPFLTHATLTRTTIGGLTAWRVAARLRPGARLPAPKAGFGAVAPTFTAGPGTAGYRPGFSAEYTLVDVPGAGVTVIWSWSVNHGERALTGNQAFIVGITLG